LNAQQSKISNAVAETFYQQYPYATNVSLNTYQKSVFIGFEMKGELYSAFYKNDEWKYTVMNYLYEKLPVRIKENYSIGKYKNRNILQTVVVFLPSGNEQFRLTVMNKNNLRYIYYSEKGRFLKQSRTI
jgi:hypothetical protein